MKKTRLCQLLGIEYPIIQAGISWVSNPELAAAVSNAGGMGVVTPIAGMKVDGDPRENLQHVIRQARSATDRPFGVAFHLGRPDVQELLQVGVEEGIRTAITFGGSPVLFTGYLKDNKVTVLHIVASVRHARSAEARGVDVVIAEGYEGGGLKGWEEIPTLALVPQVRDAVEIPVVASGGIADARGLAAALALGADGVYIGTRFVATSECIAHPRYKAAIVSAVDSGTLVAGRYHLPTRVLKTEAALTLRGDTPGSDSANEHWEKKLGLAQARDVFLEGELEKGVAYCGASAGLVSDIIGAGEVVQRLVQGAEEILNRRR